MIKQFLGIFMNVDSFIDFFINIGGKISYFLMATFGLGVLGIVKYIKEANDFWKKSNDWMGLEGFLWLSFILEIFVTVLQMQGVTSPSINVLLYGRYADIFVAPILFIILRRLYISRHAVKIKQDIFVILLTGIVNLILAFIITKVINVEGMTTFGVMNSIFISMFWQNSRLYIFVAVIFSIVVGGGGVYFSVVLNRHSDYISIIVYTIVIVYYGMVSQLATKTSILNFQKQSEYFCEISEKIRSERLDEMIFFLNTNNGYDIYDNRIKNILQFLNPQIYIKGQKTIEPDNNKTVVCSVNNQNLLELLLDGYQISYKKEDVLFLEKKNYGQKRWHQMDTVFLELGGNAIVNQREEIRSIGKQGHFILTHPYDLNEGNYRFKIVLKRVEEESGDYSKEIGFVYVTENDVEVARENIYADDMSDKIVTICPLSLDEPNQRIQLYVYLYDDIQIYLDSVYICSDY